MTRLAPIPEAQQVLLLPGCVSLGDGGPGKVSAVFERLEDYPALQQKV